jgi:hypothetical protein
MNYQLPNYQLLLHLKQFLIQLTNLLPRLLPAVFFGRSLAQFLAQAAAAFRVVD